MNKSYVVAGALCATALLVLLSIYRFVHLADLPKGAIGSATSAIASERHAEGDKEEQHAHEKTGEGEKREGQITMAAGRIAAAKIAIAKVGRGSLIKRLSVPATILVDRARVGRVAAKVVGTVSELRKGLGDTVAAGETIATLESREVADAKSEFIAATVNFDLQETLYQRERVLWDKKISSEQRMLRARATQQEALVRRDLARQKLSALGVTMREIKDLSAAGRSATGLERYNIGAPISGRVVEQLVDLGAPVGGEGQAKELYVIADLSTVWAELTVSTSDLAQIREGQKIIIRTSGVEGQSGGSIIFISPLLNQETRSARVIATVANRDLLWRPGSFVTADVLLEATEAKVVVPKSALQTVERETSVFVRTEEGFETRHVLVGNDDNQSIEITFGLEPGEQIAVSNTFLLKAEAGKAEAGHSH